MERRKCRRCGHPMTRMLTNDAGRWSACYTCLNCGYKTATVTAKSETAAEDGLERFMDRVDRALAAYDLYCQLCEMLTEKPIAKLDELLTAAKKARREQAISDGAYKQCEAENTKLKEMAAEDILRAALSGYPCNSCVNNTLDVLCDCDCADCEHHCTCHECHDSESYVWRGGK